MNTPMVMRIRRRAALVVLGLIVASPAAATAGIDGSGPLLCAVTTVLECDTTGKCERHTRSDFPSFIRVNMTQRVITVGDPDGRKSEIMSATRGCPHP